MAILVYLALCAIFFLFSSISGPGYIPKDPHLSSFPPTSGPAQRPSLAFLFFTFVLSPSKFFFWPILINWHWSFCSPPLLLHVFVNLFAVYLHLFCDVIATISRLLFHFDFADWRALRPGHTQAASSKKNRIIPVGAKESLGTKYPNISIDYVALVILSGCILTALSQSE